MCVINGMRVRDNTVYPCKKYPIKTKPTVHCLCLKTWNCNIRRLRAVFMLPITRESVFTRDFFPKLSKSITKSHFPGNYKSQAIACDQMIMEQFIVQGNVLYRTLTSSLCLINVVQLLLWDGSGGRMRHGYRALECGSRILQPHFSFINVCFPSPFFFLPTQSWPCYEHGKLKRTKPGRIQHATATLCHPPLNHSQCVEFDSGTVSMG